MYFSYAEKQGNFFSDWKLRQVAFDCTRRYLYYSGSTLSENEIIPPNDVTVGEQYLASVKGGGTSVPQSPTATGVNRQGSMQTSFPETSNQSSSHITSQWKKKIKVTAIILLAKENVIIPDIHAREKDFYHIEIQGENRPLVSGERPPPGPLLCPSTGLSGNTERMNASNEEYLRDPFFLSELYESLRNQFHEIKQERERAAQERGETLPESSIQTLESPRGRGAFGPKGSHTSFVLRFRSEYEFRRFWYTVQTVLGYDKLIGRPYRGLPPYDPRNGVVFAQIPMPMWHTFKDLDKTVIYTFLRCELFGRNAEGKLTVLLHNVYLCLTHEMLYIMRDTGNIPRWVKIQEIRHFYYNCTCQRPFLAFISDPGTPDIVVVPQPPFFGEVSIKYFNRSLAVMRVVSVMKELCFGSIDVRRVTNIKESHDPSVGTFIENFERKHGSSLVFEPLPGYFNGMDCPVPKEQLADVWREVQEMYTGRDQEVLRHSAIPLYTNYANEAPLTTEQMTLISRRLARERSSNFDVVGMSYGEAQELAQQMEEGVLAQSPNAPLPTNVVNNNSFCPNFNTSFAFAVSAQSAYGSAEARYLTQEDLASSYVAKLPEVIVDQHTVLAASLADNGGKPIKVDPEFRVQDVVNHSFNMYSHSLAKRQQNPLTDDGEEGERERKESHNDPVDSLET